MSSTLEEVSTDYISDVSKADKVEADVKVEKIHSNKRRSKRRQTMGLNLNDVRKALQQHRDDGTLCIEVAETPSGSIIQPLHVANEVKENTLHDVDDVNGDELHAVVEINEDALLVVDEVNGDELHAADKVNEDALLVADEVNGDELHAADKVNEDALLVADEVNGDELHTTDKVNEDALLVVDEVNEDALLVVEEVNEGPLLVADEVNEDESHVANKVNENTLHAVEEVIEGLLRAVDEVNENDDLAPSNANEKMKIQQRNLARKNLAKKRSVIRDDEANATVFYGNLHDDEPVEIIPDSEVDFPKKMQSAFKRNRSLIEKKLKVNQKEPTQNPELEDWKQRKKSVRLETHLDSVQENLKIKNIQIHSIEQQINKQQHDCKRVDDRVEMSTQKFSDYKKSVCASLIEAGFRLDKVLKSIDNGVAALNSKLAQRGRFFGKKRIRNDRDGLLKKRERIEVAANHIYAELEFLGEFHLPSC